MNEFINYFKYYVMSHPTGCVIKILSIDDEYIELHVKIHTMYVTPEFFIKLNHSIKYKE
jgi:hypothetical protein